MIRTYSELIKRQTHRERFDYLDLHGVLGDTTFGFDRYLNQRFYTSAQWRSMRHYVIARDRACDMAMDGYDIFDRIIVHHMNPMTPDALIQGEQEILDPEFLVAVAHRTHNAIHFGDATQLTTPLVDRREGDTKLW
jgi:hypothetical protein